MHLTYDLKTLDKIKDHPADLEKCVDLLYSLQKNRGPLVEVVTVIKYEKPTLHALLKRRISNNPGLHLLFGLSIDYAQAKTAVCSHN